MSWISIILYILVNLPKMISILKDIIALIKGAPKEQQLNVKQVLEDAIKEHKQTKDDQKLKDVLQKCSGVGCPPDLKS